jgi:Domain of unknown function (DUF4276)
MTDATAPAPWRFYKIRLLVTGKGEEQFFPELLRSLTRAGTCSFQVVKRIRQRSAITSEKRAIAMIGTGKVIPTEDEKDIGLTARNWLLADPGKLLLLIDDLEHDRREQKRAIFSRYRAALDTMLRTEEQRARASVHFLVNMLEAYYFADAAAVNNVLGTSLSDHAGDVETIRHPKNDLKALYPGFDEVTHGQAIARRLDVEHVLDNPETCASLRVLFHWCVQATGGDIGHRFRLDSGVHDEVTRPQIDRIRRVAG